MGTLTRLMQDGLLRDLDAITRLSADSINQQHQHCAKSGAVVRSYCEQLVEELGSDDAFEDENRRGLIRKVDRAIVGLSHLRDQLDPPAYTAGVGKRVDVFQLQENIKTTNIANDRRHDLLVDQQFEYLRDYMAESDRRRDEQ